MEELPVSVPRGGTARVQITQILEVWNSLVGPGLNKIWAQAAWCAHYGLICLRREIRLPWINRPDRNPPKLPNVVLVSESLHRSEGTLDTNIKLHE